MEADLGIKEQARAGLAAVRTVLFARALSARLRTPQVARVFATSSPPVDLVIHFAAVAFVGESVSEPLRYYHNITSALHASLARLAAPLRVC